MNQATLSQENWTGHQQVSLLDLLDRLLDKGVVADGELLLTVADIDLVYLGLKCVLTSVETLEKNSRESNEEFDGERTDSSLRGPKGRSNPSAEIASALPGMPPSAKGRGGPAELCGGRNDDVQKASVSAKEKTQLIETRQDFKETPFFEKPRATETSVASSGKPRNKVNIESEKVEKGLVKLVLTVVELLRKLMERQAIRRMEGGSLRPRKMEELGLAFLRLDEKMEELKKFFGLKDEDLNLNLGPLGNLV